ncbi:MAG: carbon starvation protein A [Gemmataceae bacterium]
MVSTLAVAIASFGILVLAYCTYGRFLARRIFMLDPQRPTPAYTRRDNIDFVPTPAPVLFGHHFASIAGLGPILGPALAVIWGWLPALLWVVFGCVFIGAVHDLGSLVVSLRFRGRSIGDVCRELIGPRSRLLFLLVIFFAMALAMGAFVNAISSLFVDYNPDAILPSAGLMVVAVCVGLALYKFEWPLWPVTLVALVVFAGLIVWGEAQPITTHDYFVSDRTWQLIETGRRAGDTFEMADPSSPSAPPGIRSPYGAVAESEYLQDIGERQAADEVRAASHKAQLLWVGLLLLYGFVASVLPVWLLLQPRDYINSFQLYFAMAALLLGILLSPMAGSRLAEIHAEAVRYPGEHYTMPEGVVRPLFPFLFVTVACGAVSGFHSLVSSGTTVRQLRSEKDALPIGFGAMLTEGALAVLVILACVAGLGSEAWGPQGTYTSWEGMSRGLAPQLNAVVRGGAQFLALMGIPVAYGQTLLAVTVVAFALTTLDSATRLLRFNVEDIFRSVGLHRLANRYVASTVAVAGIAVFALAPGGRALWTLFGTANQLLAALALLTVSLFLYMLGRQVLYTLIPMMFMLTTTIAAMLLEIQANARSGEWSLLVASVAILAMSLWLLGEACASFLRMRRGVLPPVAADLSQQDGRQPPAALAQSASEAASSR